MISCDDIVKMKKTSNNKTVTFIDRVPSFDYKLKDNCKEWVTLQKLMVLFFVG